VLATENLIHRLALDPSESCSAKFWTKEIFLSISLLSIWPVEGFPDPDVSEAGSSDSCLESSCLCVSEQLESTLFDRSMIEFFAHLIAFLMRKLHGHQVHSFQGLLSRRAPRAGVGHCCRR
jgi:hypothetical protein